MILSGISRLQRCRWCCLWNEPQGIHGRKVVLHLYLFSFILRGCNVTVPPDITSLVSTPLPPREHFYWLPDFPVSSGTKSANCIIPQYWIENCGVSSLWCYNATVSYFIYQFIYFCFRYFFIYFLGLFFSNVIA